MSILMLTFAVSHVVFAKATMLKGSYSESSGFVSFANFISHEHRKLSTIPVEIVKATDDLDCTFSCLKVPSCRSLNFGVATDLYGTHRCELLDTDKYNASVDFTSNQGFHHFSIPSPCESSPCKNGADCVTLYERNDYKCICSKDYHKGKNCEQRRSCAELLGAGFYQSGIYEINPRGADGVVKVFCDQKTNGGGWTMVFKYIGGLDEDTNSEKGLWKSANMSAEDVPEALTLTNNPRQHYKNRIVPNWSAFQPSEARVSLYTGASEVLSLTFNATASDQENWFSLDRLVSSPWTDIKSAQIGLFTVRGDCFQNICRSFVIHRPYRGCGFDNGWLLITNAACSWETRMAVRSIQYTKLSISTNWNTYGNVDVAEVLVVFVR